MVERCIREGVGAASPGRSARPLRRRARPHGLGEGDQPRTPRSRGDRGRTTQGDRRTEAARPRLTDPPGRRCPGYRSAQPHDPGCAAGRRPRRLNPAVGSDSSRGSGHLARHRGHRIYGRTTTSTAPPGRTRSTCGPSRSRSERGGAVQATHRHEGRKTALREAPKLPPARVAPPFARAGHSGHFRVWTPHSHDPYRQARRRGSGGAETEIFAPARFIRPAAPEGRSSARRGFRDGGDTASPCNSSPAWWAGNWAPARRSRRTARAPYRRYRAARRGC